MKTPLEWLADYVDLPESLDELLYRLTMSGTEIEDVVTLGDDWQDVVVGRVVSVEVPSGSKHLSVATIDIGECTLVAVTGAPNISVGQKVPVVRIGGLVPRGPDGGPFVLQPREMLGITGEAMVLSERELGMSDEHTGILALPDEAELGRPLGEVLGGTVLDVEAKGRTDEMSMVGVAREISAVTREPLCDPDTIVPAMVRTERGAGASIEVADPDLCSRYSALRIDGIEIGPSPRWLSRRLESAGVRSINNVVDVTNYVMLELGQPLHAFDYAAIPTGSDGLGVIIVRRSRPGETIVTLDGVERTVAPDTLLITDREGATGIAGVMGGGKSEVTDATTSILVESANFDRVNIRRSSRSLGLRTEASARFERGVPPELTVIAIARCLNLLASVCPGPLTAHQLIDVRGDLPEMPAITFDSPSIQRLLGVSVGVEDAVDALERLGFTSETHGDSATVRPPYWRRDVETVADIAEEIARMIGYETIPETLPGQDTPPVGLPPDLRWENSIRETLWGIGLSEAWTDTLSSPEGLARLFPPDTAGDPEWSRVVANPAGIVEHGARIEVQALVNPPTQERSALRITLVPTLLEVVARNLKHTKERVAFFEPARTFFPRTDDLPYERRTLAIAIAGDRDPRTWNRPTSAYDFFDLKGIVLAVLRRMGFEAADIQISSGADWIRNPALHPGRAARIAVMDSDVGYMGEVHPLVADRFEIEASVRAYVAELDIDSLMAGAPPRAGYHPVSRYPAVRRDISLTFPVETEAAAIEQSVRSTAGRLLRSARIVDVYQDASLGAGRKSIALSLEFQSDEGTLTQEQVSEVQDEIVTRLETGLGGRLRL